MVLKMLVPWVTHQAASGVICALVDVESLNNYVPGGCWPFPECKGEIFAPGPLESQYCF